MAVRHSTWLLWLLTLGAYAQQATVSTDSISVHARPDSSSEVRGKLARGASVSIELQISGGATSWCSVRGGDPPVSGYVECRSLKISKAGAAPSYRAQPYPLIEDLLSESGYQGYFSHFTDPSVLEGALSRDGASPADRDQMLEIFRRTFRAEVFLDPVRAYLQRTYEQRLAESALAWYRSAVGRRIAELEGQAVTSSSTSDFQQFVQGLPRNPPAPARLALIERLWGSVDFSELQVEMAVSVVRSMGEMLNPRLTPEKRLTEEKLQQMTAQLRQLQPMLANLGKARLLYLYRGLQDSELATYVQFWEAPQGRWFRSGIYQGGAEGARRFALDFTKAMMEAEERRRPR